MCFPMPWMWKLIHPLLTTQIQPARTRAKHRSTVKAASSTKIPCPASGTTEPGEVYLLVIFSFLKSVKRQDKTWGRAVIQLGDNLGAWPWEHTSAQAQAGRCPRRSLCFCCRSWVASCPPPSPRKQLCKQPLTKERDAGAGTGVLVQAGEPVALGKGEQHQPWLVDPPLRVFLHWEPFLKAVEILYSKAILSTSFCKKQWNTGVNGLITAAALSSDVQGLCRLTENH